MIQNLSENYGFFSPKLHLNMRNSSEVGELAQVVNYKGALGYKITEIIDILSTVKSNVTSIKPQIIPIEKGELNIRFDDVIKTAINGTKVNVVLYSSKCFAKICIFWLLILENAIYPKIEMCSMVES